MKKGGDMGSERESRQAEMARQETDKKAKSINLYSQGSILETYWG